jgi:hypothetical protein
MILNTPQSVAATGTTQSTAALAYGSSVTVTSVNSGTGVIINMDFVSRTIFNRGASNLSVYPPFGAQWETFGVNMPAGVASGGSATFQLTSGSQGYVS